MRSWFQRASPPQPPPPPPAHPHPPSLPSPQSPNAALDAYLFGNHPRAPMPMLEEPAPLGVAHAADPDAGGYAPRPSILEFRSSRFSTRTNPQRAQMLAAMAHAVHKPRAGRAGGYDDDDDSDYGLRDTHGRPLLTKTLLTGGGGRSTTSSLRTTEKTDADDDDDDDDDYPTTCNGGDDGGDDDDDDDEVGESADEWDAGDDERLALMSMPASQEVPLLEVDDDADLDVDAILVGARALPERLARTLVVDEQGFQLSRESVMLSAARLDRAAPLRAGLLFKQGFSLLRGAGGSSGGWKVRHVVLSSAKLAFFRDEGGRRRGEVDLTQCSARAIEIMPRDSVYDGAHATVWRFAVRGRGGRRVLLAAYSEAEMKDWLRALHVALALQSGADLGRFTEFTPRATQLGDRSDGPLRASTSYR
ncbi:hypothetical protein PybrP1_008496 [[Pythium] brassicae (nom. inval.)]|nr:hypothetical protein PybrP1_008496 [[Pythium] brassicae (nom. inval.)]